ncbi:MAG: hypothetical protein LUI10_11870 [Lachnospiraceae bacterium]|nr:hypothetical protein [Lachnospiraceae bacterium]
MYGFGVCIAIFTVIVTDSGSRAFSQIARVGSLGLSWCFFVFCFVYGNALTEQQRYTEFRIEMVLSALDSLNLLSTENEMTLQISGTIGMSPIIENMPQYQNTVLNRLVRTTFAGDAWIWNQYYFLHYYDLTNYNYVESADVGAEDLTILYDGYYETIYGDESNILIELKEYE